MAFQSNFGALVFVCLGCVFVPAGCAKDLGDEVGAGTETGSTETGSATETGDGDGDGDGDSILDATYLFALETSLGPDLPVQFVLDVVNWVETNDGATADFVFQLLSVEQGGVIPGECVGEPLEYVGVPFDADGNFTLDMGLVMIGGGANPIMAADIEATITLHGHLVDPDAMCGEVEGMLMSPLEFDLAGSTFAAIPLADGCDADPFPAPIYKCSML